jgi:phosphonate transport system substrate-binding protein
MAALTFAYAPSEAAEEATQATAELMALVAKKANVEIRVEALASYNQVTQSLHQGTVDLAWVPPIPYIALSRNKSVAPLASPQRGGTHYHGAIIVRADAPVGELGALVGKRAAWEDRYSAAGFVVPRIELARSGLDVKSAFAAQRFYGSHARVAQAVADGEADFGATFVRLAENGAVVGGPWSKTPALESRLRIFATFGEIPPDVIAARATLDLATRERIREALLALTKDPRGKELVSTAFGADGLFMPNPASYETLRAAAAAAVEDELLDIPT